MGRGSGTSRGRAGRRSTRAIAGLGVLVVLCGGTACGNARYEPSSLAELPPTEAPAPTDQSGPPPGDEPPPSQAPSQPPGTQGPPPSAPPESPAEAPSNEGPRGPDVPPNDRSPQSRDLTVDCARLQLAVPPTWSGTGDNGTWTFTPPGEGHGELTVAGAAGTVAGDPKRADLDKLAGGANGVKTQVRSDGSILGLENQGGSPTWRVATGAPNRTQLVTLTYAASSGFVDPASETFKADVQQLHKTVATLRFLEVGTCPGVS